MLSVLVIENSTNPNTFLIDTLLHIDPSIQIQAIVTDRQQAVEYLKTVPCPDLIFCEVMLADGLAFDIFDETKNTTPVIFLTQLDQFLVKAFKYNSIDYLVKPLSRTAIKKALEKYKAFQKHFQLPQLTEMTPALKTKQRVLVHRGLSHFSLKLEEVALFYTENKIVYVVDETGTKYLIDQSLAELTDKLTGSGFFRVNRQFLVNIRFIKAYRVYERVKLLLILNLPEPLAKPVIVSQETAPIFRKWMHEQ